MMNTNKSTTCHDLVYVCIGVGLLISTLLLTGITMSILAHEFGKLF